MATKKVRVYVLTTLLTPGSKIGNVTVVTDSDFSSNPEWLLLKEMEIEYDEPSAKDLAEIVVTGLRHERAKLLGSNADKIKLIDERIQTWLALPNEVPHDPA